MYGRRCEKCGEVRWSVLPRPAEPAPAPCPVCGARMVEERRRPGRGLRFGGAERRDHAPLSAPTR